MDMSSYRFYHLHEPDTRMLLDTFFSGDPKMMFKEESMIFPMEKLHAAFSTGHITGKLLIDISIGPLIHHLYSVCECFNSIILLRYNERCIMELRKWLHVCTGAFDWTHTSVLVSNLEGKSGQLEDKDNRLRSAIKHVVKCDWEKENLTNPVVIPQADCLLSAWLLEAISKDQNEYRKNLKKFLQLLKPGGCLILLGVINASYVILGSHTFHYLGCDEGFVRNALAEEGLTIVQCEILPRKSKSNLVDHEGILFVKAYKQK